jgi:hypothetical protein
MEVLSIVNGMPIRLLMFITGRSEKWHNHIMAHTSRLGQDYFKNWMFGNVKNVYPNQRGKVRAPLRFYLAPSENYVPTFGDNLTCQEDKDFLVLEAGTDRTSRNVDT